MTSEKSDTSTFPLLPFFKESPSASPSRILIALLLGLALASAAASCGRAAPPPQKFQQKLVILGFDGMDPHLVEKWMGEGKLPNFQKLAQQGGLLPLATTHSPESPTAWASFATGVNAGKHNIYDFLVRDTKTYMPDLGHGPARAARSSCSTTSRSRKPKVRLDPRGDVVLGHGRRAPACGRAC